MNMILLIFLPLCAGHFMLQPVNNTIGIYYNEEGYTKISNDQWTLLVYKDLTAVKTTLDHNQNILNKMLLVFENSNPKMTYFYADVKTHISMLTQISKSLALKYYEIKSDTEDYSHRTKRGIINGVGSVWKAISGNLDASDGEYFTNSINELYKDQHQVENLLKNQISVTTSVIRTFNETIQNLKVNEAIFSENLRNIEKSIYSISDELQLVEAKYKIMNICENLMASYIFLEEYIDDILSSVTFSRLKIIHTSIIKPKDLVESLQEISQVLENNHLPLRPNIASVAKYLELIELSAFQTDTKVIFVLKIPLVEPEVYTVYRSYPIPILDKRTGLHHILPTTIKYIGKEDVSMSYIVVPDYENCKPLYDRMKICEKIFPYPIDNNAICEAQIFKSLSELPRTCKTSLLLAKDYNIYEIGLNIWLIIISDPLLVTLHCHRNSETKIIARNTILKMDDGCKALIGSTKIFAKKLAFAEKNITYNIHEILIPYQCCADIPQKQKFAKLKPLQLSNINVDDLNTAQYKLNEYSNQLDKLINEPFVSKHISWFTFCTIGIVICLIIMYCICKFKNRKMYNRKSHGQAIPLVTP